MKNVQEGPILSVFELGHHFLLPLDIGAPGPEAFGLGVTPSAPLVFRAVNSHCIIPPAFSFSTSKQHIVGLLSNFITELLFAGKTDVKIAAQNLECLTAPLNTA